MSLFFRKALTWIISRLSGSKVTWAQFLIYCQVVRDVADLFPRRRGASPEAEAAANIKRRGEALQRLQQRFPNEGESTVEWLMMTALRVFKQGLSKK